MSTLQLLLLVWAVSAVLMAGTWAVSMRISNIGYVDVAWAGLMALAALLVGTLGPGAEAPRVAVALLGSLWGARLCLFLLKRVLHEPEDGRYQALRAQWGSAPGKFFIFFQGQAVVVALFALPFIAAAGRPHGQFDGWLLAAVLTWAISVSGEALADRQLADFRGDPANKGKTCRSGLWAWSRHPNYFFEWLHWFTYVFLAVGSPLFVLSLVGPVVMLLFLYRVSGIPWTEAQSLRSRGDDYRRYQEQVSPFFPLPPKRG